MNKRLSSLVIESLIIALIAVPVIVAIRIFPDLPDTIVTHYNFRGEPDAWSKKNLGYFLVLPSISLGLNIFLILLTKAISGERYEQMKNTMLFLRVFVAFLFSGITLWMISSADQGLSARFYQWISGMLFIFIAGIGWFMRTLEPNNYVGIRTTDTLKSNSVWLKTHQTGSIVFILTGIVGIALSLFIKTGLILISATIALVLLCICSWLLSRYHYRRESENETNIPTNL